MIRWILAPRTEIKDMINLVREDNKFYFITFEELISKPSENFNRLIESIKLRRVKNAPDEVM